MTEFDQNLHISDGRISDSVELLNNSILNTDWSSVNFSILTSDDSLSTIPLSDIQSECKNRIINNIPVWERVIGCKQHITHDFTIDIHTIFVVSNVMTANDYKSLNVDQKLRLIYSALLHDVCKMENIVDPEHPAKGACKASEILHDLGFEEDFISDVYFLIRYHQILGLWAAGRLEFVKVKEIFEGKRFYLLKLLKILTVADIKAVKKNDVFYTEDVKFNLSQIEKLIK